MIPQVLDTTTMSSAIVEGTLYFTDGHNVFTETEGEGLEFLCPLIDASAQLYHALTEQEPAPWL